MSPTSCETCAEEKIHVLSCLFWPQLQKYIGCHSCCICRGFSLQYKYLICHQTWTQRHHQKSHVSGEWTRRSTVRDFDWNFLKFYSFGGAILLPCHCFLTTTIRNSYVIWMQLKPSKLLVYLAGWVVGTGSCSTESSAHFTKSIDTLWGQNLTVAGSPALCPPIVFSEL